MRDKINAFIDAATDILAHLILRILPLFVCVASTLLVWHAYRDGKVVIESAALSLFTVYGVAAGLYGVNVLIKSKAATIAADRRLSSGTPGLPAAMSSAVQKIEETKARPGPPDPPFGDSGAA